MAKMISYCLAWSIAICINALLYWGIGNYFLHVFAIPVSLLYSQSLAICLVVNLIRVGFPIRITQKTELEKMCGL